MTQWLVASAQNGMDRFRPLFGARCIEDDAPRLDARLSATTLVLIFTLLGAWRLAIYAFANVMDRMGQARCGATVPTPWKYSACWDTSLYQQIAARGYDYAPNTPSSVAFFPLYPLLMRYADDLLPGGDVAAGVVVGHLALAVAAVYVFLLARIEFDDLTAWRTLFFLLVFPSAFFFSAAYTEPVFLLTVAGTLFHARRGEWLRAGLFAATGSATKLVGVMLAVPIIVEMLAQRVDLRRAPRALGGVLLAPLGAVAYFAWLQVRYGDFRVFFESQENWRRESFQPAVTYGVEWLFGARDTVERFYPASITPIGSAFLLLDVSLWILFMIAGVVLWKQVRASYGALLLASGALLGMSGNPQSLNRYLVVFFPVFMLLARINYAPLRDALAVVFLVGLGLETYFFNSALWAG